MSHLHAGLEKLSEALRAHGHPQPILGFTDNVGSDAATFIQCIESLGKDVVSVDLDEHPELAKMILPPDVNILVCQSEAEIRSACDAILEQIPEEPAIMPVGFDMEWDFTTGQLGGPRKTALVQIALHNVVYLLRTCILKRLPEALQIIISSQRVIKIGRNIGNDLAKLARDFPGLRLPSKSHQKFDGTIELGSFAKAKNVVSKATASLSSITAAALHFHLSKETQATEWSSPHLSTEQIQYAALDAWVALEIWNTIKDNKTQGQLLETASPVGQCVSFFVRKQEVARGVIAQQPLKYPNVINEETGETVMINVSVTHTRALITVTEVLAPQVQLAWHKKTLHQLQAGRTSFEAVVSLSCLRTRSPESASSVILDDLPPAEVDTCDTIIQPPVGIGRIMHEDLENIASDSDDEMVENDDDVETGNSEYIQSSESICIPSCILADVFHEMDKVGCTISRKHSLHRHFATAFSDTMLVLDKGDKQRVQAYFAKKELKWDEVRKSQPGWLWKRVRRYIPEKDILYHILEEFFNAWGPVKCSVTGQCLFSEDSWKKARAVLHDVKMGWLSDPQGIPLYTLHGFDQNGLALYHCIRGTNSVEGGVHNPIRRNFASLNASVELADALVADYRHRHNVNVGIFHKTGEKYKGHFDPWLDHEISQLRSDIIWIKKPSDNSRQQDTDPLQFSQTEEQFGIGNIPPMLRIQNDFAGPEFVAPEEQYQNPGTLPRLSLIYPMKLHLSHLQGKRKDVYTFLATAQQTKFAVTPVHTSAEFKLFHTAVSVGGMWFASHGEPNFDAMAQWWSHEANGSTIFYKLREHLSTYYKTWKECQQGIRTLIGSEVQRQPNTRRIRSKNHSATVLPAASRQHPNFEADSGTASMNATVRSMGDDLNVLDVGLMEGVDPTGDAGLMEDIDSMEDVGPMEEDVQQTVSFTHVVPHEAHQATSSAFIHHQTHFFQHDPLSMSWSGAKRPKKCALCQQEECPGRGNRKLCMFSIEVSNFYLYPYLT